MPDPDEIINWYQTFTPEPEQRKTWYGSVAETYSRVRPKYTQSFLDRSIEVAAIPSHGRILEVGCGPGTATISLARMGFEIVALEPSLEAHKIACDNAAGYPHVKIVNTTFEEWEPEDRSFDAILAATSWHWVAPEHKHIKAASLLTERGKLMLLWNTAMQPPIHVFERLVEVFERYLPIFATYKDRETELSQIGVFSAAAISSGLFANLDTEYRSNEVFYSIDDYLQLLTTYSPCIALDRERRRELLENLKVLLLKNCGDRIPLTYLSVFHVAMKG